MRSRLPLQEQHPCWQRMLKTAWRAAWVGRLSSSCRSSGRELTRKNVISAANGSVSVAKAAWAGRCRCSAICLSRNGVPFLLLPLPFYEPGCLMISWNTRKRWRPAPLRLRIRGWRDEDSLRGVTLECKPFRVQCAWPESLEESVAADRLGLPQAVGPCFGNSENCVPDEVSPLFTCRRVGLPHHPDVAR